VPHVAKLEKDSYKFLLWYLLYRQICGNPPVDNHQFGYITKLATKLRKKKKKLMSRILIFSLNFYCKVVEIGKSIHNKRMELYLGRKIRAPPILQLFKKLLQAFVMLSY
jgi:hypothetical protein